MLEILKGMHPEVPIACIVGNQSLQIQQGVHPEVSIDCKAGKQWGGGPEKR